MKILEKYELEAQHVHLDSRILATMDDKRNHEVAAPSGGSFLGLLNVLSIRAMLLAAGGGGGATFSNHDHHMLTLAARHVHGTRRHHRSAINRSALAINDLVACLKRSVSLPSRLKQADPLSTV